MTIRRLTVLNAAALAASTIVSYAGPCSDEIERMQGRIDSRIAAAASAGKSAPESSGALLHRQPTPGSIAAAEIELGEISQETVTAVREAMLRAREADKAGNLATCEQMLAVAQRTIGP